MAGAEKRPFNRTETRLLVADFVENGGVPCGNVQAALRSFRKWKNSTPSRSRRFIICGLRIISFRIAAIFDGRK
jgi:hypothetical protein